MHMGQNERTGTSGQHTIRLMLRARSPQQGTTIPANMVMVTVANAAMARSGDECASLANFAIASPPPPITRRMLAVGVKHSLVKRMPGNAAFHPTIEGFQIDFSVNLEKEEREGIHRPPRLLKIDNS
jgi:hypothetical protein